MHRAQKHGSSAVVRGQMQPLPRRYGMPEPDSRKSEAFALLSDPGRAEA